MLSTELLKEVTKLSDAYMIGQLSSETYYNLVDSTVEFYKELEMAEQTCKECDHPRHAHSIIGCTWGDKNYNRCTCQVKFTEKEKFS